MVINRNVGWPNLNLGGALTKSGGRKDAPIAPQKFLLNPDLSGDLLLADTNNTEWADAWWEAPAHSAEGWYRNHRLFLPCVQSALCALFCGNRCNQAWDEQRQMDCFCYCISVPVCICGIAYYLSVRTAFHRFGKCYRTYLCGHRSCINHLYACTPLQGKQ